MASRRRSAVLGIEAAAQALEHQGEVEVAIAGTEAAEVEDAAEAQGRRIDEDVGRRVVAMCDGIACSWEWRGERAAGQLVQRAQAVGDRAQHSRAIAGRPGLGCVAAGQFGRQQPVVASVNDLRAGEAGRAEPRQPVGFGVDPGTILVIQAFRPTLEPYDGRPGAADLDRFGAGSAEPIEQSIQIHSAKVTVQRRDQLPISGVAVERPDHRAAEIAV